MNTLGCDIIEIDRIRKVCEISPKFLCRVFTENERKYCESKGPMYQHLAGKFAAKEAVGKAIGQPLSWHDVEIINDDAGGPRVVLHGLAAQIVGNRQVTVSVSHCRDYAMAVATLEDICESSD